MRDCFLFFLGCLFTFQVFGTAQIPDILIHENDTLNLFSNPLESLYNENNLRPNDFGIGACWSTACWRGYQATWEIKNDHLYLIEIGDCCFGERYYLSESVFESLKDRIELKLLEKIESLKEKEYSSYSFRDKLKKTLGRRNYKNFGEIICEACVIPEAKANLEEFFGELCIDGQVLASWFTGNLIVPKGKQLQYVHMGYMSKYEKEMVLTIEQGQLIESNEYDNKPMKVENGFGRIKTISFSFHVPLELIDSDNGYKFILSDTIRLINSKSNESIQAYAFFHKERKTSTQKEIVVNNTIDSLSSLLNKNYNFSNKHTETVRWGAVSWVDGIDAGNKEGIRIFTISNIHSQLILYYRYSFSKQEQFTDRANYISSTITLTEFGY